MKKRTHYVLTILAMLAISACLSCTDMYDGLKEFATEETIYPASFDTISVKIGFERAEIDLSTNGRVPSSALKLAKAIRTVIECPLFDEPLVIDSVCSWVAITGLTEAEEYNLKVYTEDQYGNRSIPSEISFMPYTSGDLEQMELLSPKVMESSSTALLEWESELSGVLFDCYGYSYEYTDKNGDVQKGDGEGDIPSFFIENVMKESTVPVQLSLRIVPKKNEVAIIDTIDWVSTIPVTISESAGDVIFLKTPVSAHTIDLNDIDGPQSHSFAWTEVEGVSSYTLKVSANAGFPADKTVAFDLGNTSSVDLNTSQIADVVNSGSASCYWTVIPSVGGHAVNTQTRILKIYRLLKPTGMWLFDDVADPFKASIGRSLVETSVAGNKIESTEGPAGHDKAVFVPEMSYLTCLHEIAPQQGDSYVNEYSVSMNIKLSRFSWFSFVDVNSANNNGEWFISPSGELSLNGWWNSSRTNMVLNTWHKVIYSVKLGESVKIYLDGKLTKIINTDASFKDGDYALRPELYLFKDDPSWNDRNEAYVSEVITWKSALNDMEAEDLSEIKFR